MLYKRLIKVSRVVCETNLNRKKEKNVAVKRLKIHGDDYNIFMEDIKRHFLVNM